MHKRVVNIAMFLEIALFSTAFGQQEQRSTQRPASFAYVLQADAFAKTKAQAVERLQQCGRDWIVLDAAFSSDSPWTAADLATIRSGQPGRKVIAYLSIGEAEDYRPYWRAEWKRASTAPAWLLAENPEWKGNYRVKYWHPEWQGLMLSAIDDAMSRGFDGVYLDIVDGFESFEQRGKEFIDDRPNPETKQTYRRDMVEWVKTIAARARRTNPAALVIPQNGSQLLAHRDFLAAVDAIGIEDLFTEGNKRQPPSHSKYILGFLAAMREANKPVLLIEYPKNEERRSAVKTQAAQNGLVLLLTDRQLKTLGESQDGQKQR